MPFQGLLSFGEKGSEVTTGPLRIVPEGARCRLGSIAAAVKSDEAVPLDQALALIGAEVVTLRVSELRTLKTNGALDTNALYFVTDVGTYNGTQGTGSLFMTAHDAISLHPFVTGKFQTTAMSALAKITGEYDLDTDVFYKMEESSKNNYFSCRAGSATQIASLAFIKFDNASWYDNRFISCVLTGIHTSAEIYGCTLEKIVIDGGSFTGFKMHHHNQVGQYGANGHEIILAGNNVLFEYNEAAFMQFRDIGAGCTIVGNRFDNGDSGYIDFKHNASCNIDTSIFGVGNTITFGTASSSISHCSFGNNNAVTVDNTLTGCSIDNNRTIAFVANHTGASLIGEISTFKGTVDIDTKLAANILTIPDYWGELKVFSTALTATCTIKSFTGATSKIQRKIVCDTVVATFNNTSTLKFPTPSTSTVIQGNKQDFITFLFDDAGTKHLQVASEQY